MPARSLIAQIQNQAGADPVEIGFILGSGLGGFAAQVEGVSIAYSDLPGFPHAGVSGHVPNLVIGTIGGVRVAVFGGRVHYYEHGNADAMRLPLEVLRGLGATGLIATNAAGSVSPDIAPGDLMLIDDHINFSGRNPLIGETSERRFVSMSEAYDPIMRSELRQAADETGIDLKSGIYTWFSGPSFETPAEIRATRVLGGDAVGMSTVPEVILARFLGLKVAAISTITNMGAGLSAEALSHDHTKAMAPIGAAKLEKLLRRYLERRAG